MGEVGFGAWKVREGGEDRCMVGDVDMDGQRKDGGGALRDAPTMRWRSESRRRD